MTKVRLRPVVLAGIALMGAGVSPALASPPRDGLPATPPSSETCRNGAVVPKAERALLRMVNRTRARARRGTVRVDRRLRGAGRRHSRRMARRGFFAHESTFAWAGGRSGGQNLAQADSPRLAMRGMMSSTPHRLNLLDRGWKRIGIGAALDCQSGMVLYTVNLTT